jgi:hypothetical protein
MLMIIVLIQQPDRLRGDPLTHRDGSVRPVVTPE